MLRWWHPSLPCRPQSPFFVFLPSKAVNGPFKRQHVSASLVTLCFGYQPKLSGAVKWGPGPQQPTDWLTERSLPSDGWAVFLVAPYSLFSNRACPSTCEKQQEKLQVHRCYVPVDGTFTCNEVTWLVLDWDLWLLLMKSWELLLIRGFTNTRSNKKQEDKNRLMLLHYEFVFNPFLGFGHFPCLLAVSRLFLCYFEGF